MKNKLLQTKQLTNLKYLNMFQSTFLTESGNTIEYYFASRRPIDKLGNKSPNYTDAIKILPYFTKDGNTFIVLNYEFRHPVNDYIYDLCAGMVENQNDIENDIKREVSEELGAQVKSIQKITNPGHSSAGLSDETIACYFAEIENIGTQHLEETEDISLKIIPLGEIPEFVKKNNVGVTGSLLLQLFYWMNKKQ